MLSYPCLLHRLARLSELPQSCYSNRQSWTLQYSPSWANFVFITLAIPLYSCSHSARAKSLVAVLKPSHDPLSWKNLIKGIENYCLLSCLWISRKKCKFMPCFRWVSGRMAVAVLCHGCFRGSMNIEQTRPYKRLWGFFLIQGSFGHSLVFSLLLSCVMEIFLCCYLSMLSSTVVQGNITSQSRLKTDLRHTLILLRGSWSSR